MDVNLDILKRELLDQLERSGVAVFYSNAGGLENLPMVLWDTEHYPDHQLFLEAARKAGATLMVFGSRELNAEDVDELLEQMEDCDLSREEQRELERRLRDMRVFEGRTCALEMAFDHQGRMYVWEAQSDWYEEFLEIEDEIAAHSPEAEEDEDSLGGPYFSRN